MDAQVDGKANELNSTEENEKVYSNFIQDIIDEDNRTNRYGEECIRGFRPSPTATFI